MNKELEKILKKFDIILKNYELDKKIGQLSVDSICNLYPTEIMDLKKYIQDLQHQLEEKDKVINEAIEFIKSLKIDYQPYELTDFETRKLLEILEINKEGEIK